MILTRIVPSGGPQDTKWVDTEQADARERLAELYRPPREEWMRLNFIASVSGSVAGSDGTSETLTNRADRLILGVLRSLADAVLIGAASVRKEGYFVPRTAALAIVTGSGDFVQHRITAGGDRGPLLVLCPASAVDRARATLGDTAAELVELPDNDGVISAEAITTALRQRGYRSLVCEGGPKLAAHLVAADEVDEVCLTTSPTLGGGALSLLGGAAIPQRRLALTQLLSDDANGLYARWSLHADAI